jgi:hypothetical protein
MKLRKMVFDGWLEEQEVLIKNSTLGQEVILLPCRHLITPTGSSYYFCILIGVHRLIEVEITREPTTLSSPIYTVS